MAQVSPVPVAETQRAGAKELVLEMPTTEAQQQSGFRGYIVERSRKVFRPIEKRLNDFIQNFDDLKKKVQTICEQCGPDGQLQKQVSEVKSEVETLEEQSIETEKDVRAQLQDLSTASGENSERCEKNAAGVRDMSEQYTEMEQRLQCTEQSMKDTQMRLQDLTTTSKENYNESASRCDKLDRQIDELREDMQMKKSPSLNEGNSAVESQLKWLKSQLEDEQNQRKRLEEKWEDERNQRKRLEEKWEDERNQRKRLEERLQAITEQMAQQAVEAESQGSEQPGQTMDHAQAVTARQEAVD